jgi:hypothetical protein
MEVLKLFIEETMIASVTELNLKNFWSFLKFIPHAMRSHRQARQSAGLVSISTKSDGILVQRTLTVWKDEKSMRDFVRSGDHLSAMKTFPNIANTSFTAHFETTDHPTWEGALKHLKSHGRKVSL